MVRLLILSMRFANINSVIARAYRARVGITNWRIGNLALVETSEIRDETFPWKIIECSLIR